MVDGTIEPIQLRRGLAADWYTANPIPLQGEPCLELDTGRFRTGDGTTNYNELPYINLFTVEQRLDALTDGGSSGGLPYASYDGSPVTIKLIVYADNSIKGVPLTTGYPATPTGITATPHVQSAYLAWSLIAEAASYEIWRNGALLATTTDTYYRDWAVVTGGSYGYQIRAVNAYGMVSALSAVQNVYCDPSLNVAPVAVLTTWPVTNIPGQKQIVRLAASDADAQVLALALSVDSGALSPTADPSVWYLTTS